MGKEISAKVKGKVLSAVETSARGDFSSMEFQPVHDITHVERVVVNSIKICVGENLDPFLPTICAWLHDIGRLQEQLAKTEGKKVFHAEESAKRARIILSGFANELGEENIAAIIDAIARHSLKNANDDSILTQVLKDADRLDGLGALSFPRVFAWYYTPPIYNPDNPFEVISTSETFLKSSGKATQIGAFFRNMEWFLWLRLKTAIELGRPRIKLMLDFLYQFAVEIGRTPDEIDTLPIVIAVKKVL